MRQEETTSITLDALSRSGDGVASDRSWFDDSALPMWVCDVDTLRFLEVNDAALEHYGASREEFCSRHVFDLHRPEPGQSLEASRLVTGRGFRCWVPRKDGIILRLEVSCSPIQYADRAAFFAIARDIQPARNDGPLSAGVPAGSGEATTYTRDALEYLGKRAISEIDFVSLLDESTRCAAEALEADHGRLVEFVFDRSVRRRSEFLSDPSGVLQKITPVSGTTIDVDVHEQAAVLVTQVRNENRWPRDPRLVEWGLTSGVCVTVPGPQHPFGLLAVHTREPRTFGYEEILFLQAVANLVALAAIRESEREMRGRLIGRIVSARDEERERLARELHDETGQSLTALLVGLVTVEQSRNIERTRSLAMQLRQITARTIEDVGRLARGLHPSVLTDLGLVEAVRRHVADFKTSCGMEVDLRISGLDGPRLRPRLETALYRVLQEALTNCARHSKARQVDVRLYRFGGEATLVVSDDGVGFDVTPEVGSDRVRGLGLHGMRERATRAGGILTIESVRRAGTRLTVRIPMRPIRMSHPRNESSEKQEGKS